MKFHYIVLEFFGQSDTFEGNMYFAGDGTITVHCKQGTIMMYCKQGSMNGIVNNNEGNEKGDILIDE